MAELRDIFKTKKKISLSAQGFDAIDLDAAISISHSRSATITDNEVEESSSLTDHYRVQPKKLVITGLVSEVPLPSSFNEAAKSLPVNFVTSRIAGLGGAVTQRATGIVSQNVLEQSSERRQTYLNKLEEFMSKKVLLTVVTGLTIYTDMMIESLEMPENAQLGESLQVTINLREVLIVQSETVELPEIKTKGSTGHSATTSADLGSQKPKVTSPQEQERGSSVLFKLFN